MSVQTKIDGNILKSMAVAFAGFSIWAFGDALVRFLKDYPSELLAFLASSTTLVLLSLFSKQLGGFKRTFQNPKLGLRIFRGLILSVPGFLSYIAFTHLELPTAYALIFMAPFCAKIFSIFLTGEMISMRSWMITALGFAGILIVLRPGMVPLSIGSIAALGLAVFFAFGYVLGRYIGEEHQTPLSLAIFTYFFVALGTAWPAFQAYQNLPPELAFSWFDCSIIFLIGSLGFLGSPLVGKAYASAPSAYIAPIHYTQMVWGIALGAFLFGEYPDFWTLIGGGVIILAGLLLIRYTRAV